MLDRIEIEWLQQVIGGAILQACDRIGHGPIGCDDHDFDVGADSLDPAKELPAVNPRHPEIGDHDVGKLLLENFERTKAPVGFEDIRAQIAQAACEQLPLAGVVVDDQEARMQVHGRSPPARRSRMASAPPPSRLRNSAVPPCSCATLRTSASPSPVPCARPVTKWIERPPLKTRIQPWSLVTHYDANARPHARHRNRDAPSGRTGLDGVADQVNESPAHGGLVDPGAGGIAGILD